MEDDEYNRNCVEHDYVKSTHADLLFGVFICDNCATNHMKKLYDDVSRNIVDLHNSNFNELELRIMDKGGNKRFIDFLKHYELEKEPIQKKFTSTAALYYSRMLDSEVRD